MRKIFNNLLLISVSVFFIVGCSSPGGDDNGGNNNNNNGQDNPVPTLNSISPTSKVNHMPSFTLTVNGTNFITSSKIVFNGTEKNTTYVSAAELTCTVDPDEITLASTARYDESNIHDILSTNVPVKVRSPAPGGGDSGTKNFKITDKHTFNGPDKLADIEVLYTSTHKGICAKSPGYVYAIWYDYTSGSKGTYFSYSTDQGVTWSTPERMFNSPDFYGSKIDTDSSGNICVLGYNDTGPGDGIHFTRSTDHGNTWSSPKTIAQSSDNYGDRELFVDSADNINTIYLKDSYLFFSRSTDNGANWSTPVQIYSKNNIRTPKFTVADNGNIYVVWKRQTLGIDLIYFIRSTNDGSSWGGLTEMERNWKFASHPDIAVNKAGDIYVVYSDSRTIRQYINLVKSTDKGATWSAMKQISTKEMYYSLDLAVDNAGNAFAAWQSTQNTNSDWNIYYTDSFDDGVTWPSSRNISETSGGSFTNPVISLDSEGNIYILCIGNFSGNWEIDLIYSQR